MQTIKIKFSDNKFSIILFYMEFYLSFIKQKLALEPDTPISYSHILVHSIDIGWFYFLNIQHTTP
jgi:hypothetical protein